MSPTAENASGDSDSAMRATSATTMAYLGAILMGVVMMFYQ